VKVPQHREAEKCDSVVAVVVAVAVAVVTGYERPLLGLLCSNFSTIKSLTVREF